jgi:hypothetical protein
MAAQLIAMGKKPSLRLMAKLLGVAPSTIKRWFPNGDFIKQAERISHWFDEAGHRVRSNKLPSHKDPKKGVAS